MDENRAHLVLTELPDDILDEIMSNLSYDEISKNRLVCRKFNDIGKKLLNRGYRFMKKCIQESMIYGRKMLPRRNSLRRKHPLYKKYSILRSIRLSVFMWTNRYDSHIEKNLYSFVAGKVIDEVFRLLIFLKRTDHIAAPGDKITNELDDLIGMAIEHFEEKIEPFIPSVEDSAKETFDKISSKIHSRLRKNNTTVLQIKKQVDQMKAIFIVRSSRTRLQISKLQRQNREKDERLSKMQNDLSYLKSELESFKLDFYK